MYMEARGICYFRGNLWNYPGYVVMIEATGYTQYIAPDFCRFN
jgi:hypothetical protein